MRILFTNSHPSDLLDNERAGHLVRANSLIAALRTNGHQVDIVEAAAGGAAQAAASAYRNSASVLPQRVRLVARDLVRIAQSFMHGFRVARTARRRGADVIVETHNAMSIAGAIGSILARRPLVLDDVTPATEEDSYYQLGIAVLGRLVRRFTLGRASLLVTVSSAIEQALISEAVKPTRIAVVPNGHLGRAPRQAGQAWRAEHNVGKHELMVTYIGSFQTFHDVPLLVRACAEGTVSALTRLVLVGHGETLADTKQLAHKLGIDDRTSFVGRVPNSEVPVILAASDVAVLPATSDYMNPMKVYEYLAAGVAVVAPDQRAVREVVGEVFPGDAGAVGDGLESIAWFTPGSVPELAGAIARASTFARSEVEVPGSWNRRATSLAQAINELVSRP